MNSTSDPKTSAHLLTYDSILGKLGSQRQDRNH